uniref:Putative secreted peptide n=1 Tax=Anopheles braziliensis TaxID=58242 RepID=A0A2M3ZQF1_9DIPT
MLLLLAFAPVLLELLRAHLPAFFFPLIRTHALGSCALAHTVVACLRPFSVTHTRYAKGTETTSVAFDDTTCVLAHTNWPLPGQRRRRRRRQQATARATPTAVREGARTWTRWRWRRWRRRRRRWRDGG